MTKPREIRVIVHRDGESWWAESSDVAGFTAAADTARELKQLIGEGVPFALDVDPRDLRITLETADGKPMIFADAAVNRR
ncbi:MAG: hypothetical protein U0990_02185 [Candidatus Nanopelagicales bacterium]|nr:hypothetical protein [Candidatus Nanopelagicales bacterium]MDZ4248879.1 hypothetical protein [Candidatus Nanopelagicales bacterium]